MKHYLLALTSDDKEQLNIPLKVKKIDLKNPNFNIYIEVEAEHFIKEVQKWFKKYPEDKL